MYNGNLMEYVLNTEENRVEIPMNALGLSCNICLEKWTVNNNLRWNFVESTDIIVWTAQKGTDGTVSMHKSGSVALTAERKYRLSLRETGDYITVYTLDYEAESQIFKKYRIADLQSITVGSAQNSDIVVNRKGVQPTQLQMLRGTDDTMVLQKFKDVYLNNVLVTEKTELLPFDMLWFNGIKLVYFGDIIAVNCQNVVTSALHEINALDMIETTYDIEEQADYGYFSRAPRQLKQIDNEKVVLETPPAKKEKDSTPWFLTIGPTITMPIPMILAMVINMKAYAANGMGRSASMYIGMFVSMIMSAMLGVMWAQIRKKWQTKQINKFEKKRVEGYNKYLDKNRALLQQRIDETRFELNKQFLQSDQMATQLDGDNLWLWNRNPNHSDFGCIRIGVGNVPNTTEIELPKEKFSLDEDDLVEAPKQVYNDYAYMQNMPVTVNLFELNMLGVTGSQQDMLAMLNSMLVQTAGLYSYTDVKIGVCANTETLNNLMWVRFLPHLQISDSDLRLFVYDRNSNERVVAYLVNLIQSREEVYKETDKVLPHYVIFCLTDSILESETIRNYANSIVNYGITFVLLFGEIATLPNNCTCVLQNDTQYSGLNILTNAIDEKCTIQYDMLDSYVAETFARQLSRFTVREAVMGAMPTKVDFFETLGISKIEQWNLSQHYKEAHTYESIRGLIGVGSGGLMKYLDIHEKKHGPHGLIAGMTGSGKSEMLQTIMISWALNYSPDELAFVLIDYKGGGMANLFLGMPHVVGVLTNISDDADETNDTQSKNRGANLTNRALSSIKSEIKRRQTIFKRYKINHIDDYTKMYQRKEVKEPLPHLVIISDEFAELRKEQHDFISELVSAARVGRSLGVHLILATQKPAGVVDDEIFSNSRYRLSLRVQDKADSMSMLKRPEAAYLTQIGRLYMQVGSDEIFEEIQAAYSGGKYVPLEQVKTSADTVCDLVRLDGSIVEFPKSSKQKSDLQKGKSQLETCVDYITAEVKRLHIPVPAPLWMPFLPTKLYLADLVSKDKVNALTAVYGCIDDVAHQQQYPIVYDALACGNTVIAGISGCGKSTLVQTLLYSLAVNNTSEQFNFYVYDYSGGILKHFAKLPHCGGVVLNDVEEAEKAQRVLQLLQDIMQERRRLFDKAGVGSFVEYRNVGTLPLVCLVIDGYATWRAVHEESLSEKLLVLLRDGTKYGIQVIATLNATNEMTYRHYQYFTTKITLQLSEPSAYRDYWNTSAAIMPEPVKGRGLTNADGNLVEFQTALAIKDDSEMKRNNMLREWASEVAAQGNMPYARAIPVLPKDKSYKELMVQTNAVTATNRNEQFLLGYTNTKVQAQYVDIRSMFIFIVSDISASFKGGTKFLGNMYAAAKAHDYTTYCLQFMDKRYCDCDVIRSDAQLFNFVKTMNMLYTKVTTDWAALEQSDGGKTDRSVLRAEFVAKLQPTYVFIDSLAMLADQLQSESFCKYFAEQFKMDAKMACVEKQAYKIVHGMLKSGANYGVYFFVGVDSSAYAQKALPVFSDVLTSSMGVHFGGFVDKASFLKGTCITTYAQRNAEMSLNMAIYRCMDEEQIIWVPETDMPDLLDKEGV